MANKFSYSGPHAEVYAEGFIAGVTAGEALAKSEASDKLTDEDVKRINSGAMASMVSTLTPAQKLELDSAFDLVKQTNEVRVSGAVQQFGVSESLVK